MVLIHNYNVSSLGPAAAVLLPSPKCSCQSAHLLGCFSQVQVMVVGKVTEQNLGKDFETLLGMLRPEESVNKEDIRILKVFGPKVFWVTGTRTTDDVLDGGIVVSHHVSDGYAVVFAILECKNLCLRVPVLAIGECQ